MKKNTFTGLDYWRLADEISVIDASFLTLLCEPGHFRLINPSEPSSSDIAQIAGWSGDQLERAGELEDGTPLVDPSKFRAVFKALRNAILSNKLKARIVNRGRKPEYDGAYDGMVYRVPEEANEEARHYGLALSRGVPTIFSNSDSILSTSDALEDRFLYILEEPDWTQTTIEVEDLKIWFAGRGVAPAFFFPEGLADSYLDKTHPRYSPKLAAAISAWEAVSRPSKNKSVKQTLADWVTSNGVQYGLGNSDSIVTPTVAEEIAKIANWQTSGGANPTYVEQRQVEDGDAKPVQNFEEVKEEVARRSDPISDSSDDIPF